MAKKKARVREEELEGFKSLEPVSELLDALRQEAGENPNRVLHFDHYVTLLIFYFFNPTLSSLRGLQASTQFKKVRKKLKLPRGASLGSLSASASAALPPEIAPRARLVVVHPPSLGG